MYICENIHHDMMNIFTVKPEYIFCNAKISFTILREYFEKDRPGDCGYMNIIHA